MGWVLRIPLWCLLTVVRDLLGYGQNCFVSFFSCLPSFFSVFTSDTSYFAPGCLEFQSLLPQSSKYWGDRCAPADLCDYWRFVLCVCGFLTSVSQTRVIWRTDEYKYH